MSDAKPMSIREIWNNGGRPTIDSLCILRNRPDIKKHERDALDKAMAAIRQLSDIYEGLAP